ncbi:unnamed protein product [Closterium sp. Naga37s-1]|nr:unnamed protein product [Closterium sp. Naga37s-1]
MPRVPRSNAVKTTKANGLDNDNVNNTPPPSPLKDGLSQQPSDKPLPGMSTDLPLKMPGVSAEEDKSMEKRKGVEEVNANDAANTYGVTNRVNTGDADDSDGETAAEELDPEKEGDGYLSDDSDEMFDPVVAADIASQTKISLTLLVTVNRIAEVPRTKATIVALLDDCKEHLSPDVLQTTTYQKLLPTFFSRQKFGRLQVTFNNARDAEFVRDQVIDHECVDDKFVKFTWQFPENASFLKERSANPTAIEVVLKAVPAEISPEMFRHLLKRILKDPALVLVSTGGLREEWICVQAACEKAQGTRFEQASAHIASARHRGGLRKPGSATREAKGSQKLSDFKKDFGKKLEK